MEIHIEVKLVGDGFATDAERLCIETIVEEVHKLGLGRLLDSGSGDGYADLYFRAGGRDDRQVLARFRAILNKTEVANRSFMRVIRDKRAKRSSMRLPEAGSAFAFRMDTGYFGCCRALRRTSHAEETFRGGAYVLIATSAWVGKEVPSPANIDLRKILVLTHHSYNGTPSIYWISSPTPEDYIYIGRIEPSAEEQALACNVSGNWNSHLHLHHQLAWDEERRGRK